MFIPSFTRDVCRSDLQLGLFRCSVRSLRQLHWLPSAPSAPVMLAGPVGSAARGRSRALRARVAAASRLAMWGPSRFIWAVGASAQYAWADTCRAWSGWNNAPNMPGVFCHWFGVWFAFFATRALRVGGAWGC